MTRQGKFEEPKHSLFLNDTTRVNRFIHTKLPFAMIIIKYCSVHIISVVFSFYSYSEECKSMSY